MESTEAGDILLHETDKTEPAESVRTEYFNCTSASHHLVSCERHCPINILGRIMFQFRLAVVLFAFVLDGSGTVGVGCGQPASRKW